MAMLEETEAQDSVPAPIAVPKINLQASNELAKAHQEIYDKISRVPNQIGLMETSVNRLNRMIMSAEVKRKTTFGALHSAEFRRFPDVSQQKSLINQTSQIMMTKITRLCLTMLCLPSLNA